ncbi:hypothetical protein ElyMa_006582700 [Elysia marginata]|uniref:Uncharacterized protein n=1 Tax=Elysia marginata TaxID=1093978 RepID=A0AAV4IF60_9GAST|nr:hypothetical protein ElyMa_006582700 [Elysia marginata]
MLSLTYHQCSRQDSDHKGTTEQLLAFTSHNDAGFENKLKTGAVLIDLSADYGIDIVWTGEHHAQTCKTDPVQKKKILKILSLLTGTRQFHVIFGRSQ